MDRTFDLGRRLRRIDPQLVIVMVVLLAVIVLFVRYLDHRRHVSEARQHAIDTAQAHLNQREAATIQRLQETRRAVCIVFRRFPSPRDTHLRQAWRRAAQRAHCGKARPAVVTSSGPPLPRAFPPRPRPGPTVTVTVTRHAAPRREPHSSSSPACTTGPVVVRRPCPTIPPIRIR